MSLIIGIDPGLRGAVSLVERDEQRNTVTLINVVDAPVMPRGKKGRDLFDPFALRTILSDWSVRLNNGIPIKTWIERVGGMPGQGGMFAFGETCGAIRATLAVMEWPFEYVAPVKWKGAVGLKGFDKGYALTIAKQLVPTSAPALTMKKHVDRAEAILIAYYGALHVEFSAIPLWLIRAQLDKEGITEDKCCKHFGIDKLEHLTVKQLRSVFAWLSASAAHTRSGA